MTRDDSGKAAAFGVRWLATALGWEGFARQFGQSSPKGSNSTAQGEALGFGMQTANSPERASLAASFAPSGLNRCCVARSPRALPWADEFEPFGLGERIRWGRRLRRVEPTQRVKTGSVSQPRMVEVGDSLALARSTSHSGNRFRISSRAT